LFLLGHEAVSPLIKFLSDSDQGKRVAAAKGLAYIGNSQGMQALRNAVNAEKDEEAKSGISCFLAGGLVDTESETDLNFLKSAVKSAHRADDEDWDFPGFCAALALGMRGGTDSLSLLRMAAKPDDMEEIGAPLPATKGICFLCAAVCVASEKQNPSLPKGVFPMQQISKQPAFELGQIVATPGALAALKKSGQQPGEFLTAISSSSSTSLGTEWLEEALSG